MSPAEQIISVSVALVTLHGTLPIKTRLSEALASKPDPFMTIAFCDEASIVSTVGVADCDHSNEHEFEHFDKMLFTDTVT